MWCARRAHRLLGASPGAAWGQRSLTISGPSAGSDCQHGTQGPENRESSSQGPENRESSSQGAENREISSQGAENRESSSQGAETREISPQGAENREISSQGAETREISSQGAETREISSQGAGNLEHPIASTLHGVDRLTEPPTGNDPLDNRLSISMRSDTLGASPVSLRSRFWRRSLSPLDRVSHLLPHDFVSQEVLDLMSAGAVQGGIQDVHSAPLCPGQPFAASEEGADVHSSSDMAQGCSSPQGAPFTAGDLVVSEFKRRHYTEFKSMFLLTPTGKLLSNWGAISHKDIVGKLPGQRKRTSTGVTLLLKRPSLEEYVLMMKRGPTISYPKDMTAMMMMMDVNPGDTVLEAGSGSGGMSLFLSRAVGSAGCVYSFEVRADHHAVAKKNFQRWKNAWEHRGRDPWPDNVTFINEDISSVLRDISRVMFDAVALDMLSPQVALPTILPNLKQGAVCAVYLANITQVVDLLEAIRSCQLSFVCEKIVEVSWKDWLVAPSVRKDGSTSQKVKPERNVESNPENANPDEESDGDAEDSSGGVEPFGQVPYIARPLPWQTGHTAFLVQLRKFRPEQSHSLPEEPS